MQARTVTKIETSVDRAASTLFALACGYVGYLWFSATAAMPLAGAEAAAPALLGYLLSSRMLGAVQPKARKLPVPIFDVRDVEPIEEPELLLTERFEPSAGAAEELLLDDILAELEPDSRVVRLFDPAAMPTAGEMKSRIDRHLDGQASAAQASEAAQALHDALAELRRSIR
jgi:hypothetical protein